MHVTARKQHAASTFNFSAHTTDTLHDEIIKSTEYTELV